MHACSTTRLIGSKFKVRLNVCSIPTYQCRNTFGLLLVYYYFLWTVGIQNRPHNRHCVEKYYAPREKNFLNEKRVGTGSFIRRSFITIPRFPPSQADLGPKTNIIEFTNQNEFRFTKICQARKMESRYGTSVNIGNMPLAKNERNEDRIMNADN
jgi:hypothetical protein